MISYLFSVYMMLENFSAPGAEVGNGVDLRILVYSYYQHLQCPFLPQAEVANAMSIIHKLYIYVQTFQFLLCKSNTLCSRKSDYSAAKPAIRPAIPAAATLIALRLPGFDVAWATPPVPVPVEPPGPPSPEAMYEGMPLSPVVVSSGTDVELDRTTIVEPSAFTVGVTTSVMDPDVNVNGAVPLTPG